MLNKEIVYTKIQNFILYATIIFVNFMERVKLIIQTMKNCKLYVTIINNISEVDCSGEIIYYHPFIVIHKGIKLND